VDFTTVVALSNTTYNMSTIYSAASPGAIVPGDLVAVSLVPLRSLIRPRAGFMCTVIHALGIHDLDPVLHLRRMKGGC
jgi:hypothetical protein